MTTSQLVQAIIEASDPVPDVNAYSNYLMRQKPEVLTDRLQILQRQKRQLPNGNFRNVGTTMKQILKDSLEPA